MTNWLHLGRQIRAQWVPPPLAPPTISAPAFPLDALDAVCPDCVRQQGLCGDDRCRRQVLPLLKRPTGLLRLMGEALVEQTARQTDRTLPVSVEQEEHKKRKQQARSQRLARSRKNARAVARSQRRGAFGLALKIAGGSC